MYMNRRYFIYVFLMVAYTLAGCESETPTQMSASNTPHVASLKPLGSLYTVMVDVAGHPRRFLLDTGGGMTVFSPELAKQAGLKVGGPLTGFRMSGERVVSPRAESGKVDVSGWTSPPHTVLVLDINKLLPKDWPRIDGLLSLATFNGHLVTIDLPGRKLVVDDAVPTNARSVRTHFERSMMGLSLVAFFASKHGDTDVWFEVDTGSDSAAILNESIATLIGLKPAPGACWVAQHSQHDDRVSLDWGNRASRGWTVPFDHIRSHRALSSDGSFALKAGQFCGGHARQQPDPECEARRSAPCNPMAGSV